MDLRFVTSDGWTGHEPSEMDELRRRTDGFVWLDAMAGEDGLADLLASSFGAHPLVTDACTVRNHVPTVHGYDEAFFLELFAPLAGAAGHVHLLELDVLVGPDHLVTVHGPLNPIVDPAEATRETDATAARIEAGRMSADTPVRLLYSIASAVARRQRGLVGMVAEKLPGLEKEVMRSSLKDPEALLEQLFLIRHELITARTMAAQSHDVLCRMLTLGRRLPERDRELLTDLAEQFDRVRSVGDGEAQFLFGVIELYQTKVNTKMTLAMERLAVIAAVTLPITALASIFGMSAILDGDHDLTLVLVLVAMVLMSAQLLRWTHRQGWW